VVFTTGGVTYTATVTQTAGTYTLTPQPSVTISNKPLSVYSAAAVKVTAVTLPVPEYTIATAQEGEDSYTYEVYFSGRQGSGSLPLSVSTCSVSQTGGMRYGVQVVAVQEGGSEVVQELVISSQRPFLKDMSATPAYLGYFKLVYNSNNFWGGVGNGPIVISSTAGSSYSPFVSSDPGILYGVSASVLQGYINNALGYLANDPSITTSLVTVTRSEFGTPEEDFTYKYQITFSQSSRSGAINPLSVLGDRGVSAPLYVPINQTSTDPNWPTLNDLSVSGSLNTTRDTLFWVRASITR
jgi:hypothetical protein